MAIIMPFSFFSPPFLFYFKTTLPSVSPPRMQPGLQLLPLFLLNECILAPPSFPLTGFVDSLYLFPFSPFPPSKSLGLSLLFLIQMEGCPSAFFLQENIPSLPPPKSSQIFPVQFRFSFFRPSLKGEQLVIRPFPGWWNLLGTRVSPGVILPSGSF